MLRRVHPPTYLFAFTAVVASSVLLSAPPARADPGETAAAQALFNQARALMAAGKPEEACPKFEESQKLDPGSGTLINLALCYEKTGRTASAWSTYRDAAAAAKVAGNVERERGARERAAALAPKVSKLTVIVPPEARVQGLVVSRDGVEVGAAQWGVPIATDEGPHELSARAPLHQAWQTHLDLASDGATASVNIPKLDEAPVSPALAPTAAAAAATSPPSPDAAQASAEPRSSGLGPQRIGALAAAGVGVVGVVVGTIFGVEAISKKNDAEKTCTGTRCTSQAGADSGNDANAAGNVATVGFVIGAVGLAGGAVLWFTAPSGPGSTRVGLGPTGVRLQGSF